MGAKIQIRKKYQITLPVSIRKQISHLIEVGDVIEAEVKENKIVLYPKKLIDPEQGWFWTEEWQEDEKKVDEDIKAGRVIGPFKSVKKMKEHLENK